MPLERESEGSQSSSELDKDGSKNSGVVRIIRYLEKTWRSWLILGSFLFGFGVRAFFDHQRGKVEAWRIANAMGPRVVVTTEIPHEIAEYVWMFGSDKPQNKPWTVGGLAEQEDWKYKLLNEKLALPDSVRQAVIGMNNAYLAFVEEQNEFWDENKLPNFEEQKKYEQDIIDYLQKIKEFQRSSEYAEWISAQAGGDKEREKFVEAYFLLGVLRPVVGLQAGTLGLFLSGGDRRHIVELRPDIAKALGLMEDLSNIAIKDIREGSPFWGEDELWKVSRELEAMEGDSYYLADKYERYGTFGKDEEEHEPTLLEMWTLHDLYAKAYCTMGEPEDK